MESSVYRYVLKHSRNGQIGLVLLSAISFPVMYVTLELPKKVINLLEGEDVPDELLGLPVDQLNYLMILSFAFLLAVLANGGIKYFINVYRGVLGERLLRRLRYELFERILRFPVPHFKRVSQGELVPMITAETEPLGGFFGESFSLPIYQGGMLFTYLYFIFLQDVFLGAAAIALYPFQLYVIPKLQKRVNELAKERVRTVRSLSGRIGETISGINEVHSNDTSRFERAHVSERLGKIFEIRYAIYRRKFFIKFLNNFIAQLTPFFFYSVGGYFVLRGDLSIGSMVAVLVAYKDLAGPWKELLAYYQRREDIKVKYVQVIDQFSPQGLIDTALIDSDTELMQLPSGELRGSVVSYTEDGLYLSIDNISFVLPMDQHTAVVGLSNSGKDELAQLISRLISPTSGVLTIGEQKLETMPEALLGRRVGYVGQNTYLFTGSVHDNLLYPLKHIPVAEDKDEGEKQRASRRLLAQQSGNSEHGITDEWVDYRSIGVEGEQAFRERVHQVLRCVELDADIYQFGLLSQVDQSQNVDLAKRIMLAREHLRESLAQSDMAKLVEPFDQEKYNANMSVGENLLFGTIYDSSIDSERLAENAYIYRVLDETDLTNDLIAIGRQVAEIMLDLFSDVEPDSELFEQFSFINADDLPEFQQLLVRTREMEASALSADDKNRLLSLPFKLILTRHRLGLIDESIQQRILQARSKIRAGAEQNNIGVEFFDETQYNPRISVQDNVLFGKLFYGQANAQQKVNELIRDVIDKFELRDDIIDAGLGYEVGVGGARLSSAQRQKLGLARSLIKSPDMLIVNEAMAGLDSATERRLITHVRAQMQSKSVLWVLARARLAEVFDRVLVMERGHLIAEGNFSDLSLDNPTVQQLLEDE